MKQQIFRSFLTVLVSSSLVLASEPRFATSAEANQTEDLSKSSYGPELPPGEDGQANLDAAQKLRILYYVGGVVLLVFTLVLLAKQAEEIDTSWN